MFLYHPAFLVCWCVDKNSQYFVHNLNCPQLDVSFLLIFFPELFGHDGIEKIKFCPYTEGGHVVILVTFDVAQVPCDA